MFLLCYRCYTKLSSTVLSYRQYHYKLIYFTTRSCSTRCEHTVLYCLIVSNCTTANTLAIYNILTCKTILSMLYYTMISIEPVHYSSISRCFFLGHSQPRRKMGSPHCDFIDSWGSTAQHVSQRVHAKWPKTKRSRWGKRSNAGKSWQPCSSLGCGSPGDIGTQWNTLRERPFSFEFPGWALYSACLDLFVLDIARYSSVCVCTVNGYHLPSILVWFAQGQVGLWLHVTRDVYPYTVFHVQLYFCFSSTCKCHLAAGTCCCTAIRPLHGLVVIIQTQHMTCKWYESSVCDVIYDICNIWSKQRISTYNPPFMQTNALSAKIGNPIEVQKDMQDISSVGHGRHGLQGPSSSTQHHNSFQARLQSIWILWLVLRISLLGHHFLLNFDVRLGWTKQSGYLLPYEPF